MSSVTIKDVVNVINEILLNMEFAYNIQESIGYKQFWEDVASLTFHASQMSIELFFTVPDKKKYTGRLMLRLLYIFTQFDSECELSCILDSMMLKYENILHGCIELCNKCI